MSISFRPALVYVIGVLVSVSFGAGRTWPAKTRRLPMLAFTLNLQAGGSYTPPGGQTVTENGYTPNIAVSNGYTIQTSANQTSPSSILCSDGHAYNLMQNTVVILHNSTPSTPNSASVEISNTHGGVVKITDSGSGTVGWLPDTTGLGTNIWAIVKTTNISTIAHGCEVTVTYTLPHSVSVYLEVDPGSTNYYVNFVSSSGEATIGSYLPVRTIAFTDTTLPTAAPDPMPNPIPPPVTGTNRHGHRVRHHRHHGRSSWR